MFDLDPGPGVPWKRVVEGALALKTEVENLDLKSFVRTSGGKGLHVVVPLMPGVDWGHAKVIAKTIAQVLATREPAKYVAVMSKTKREGRIFIDYLRNGRGATAIANYSTRSRPHGPVATPLRWDELASLRSAAQFTVRNVRQRLSRLKRDPWNGFELPDQ